MTYLLTLLSGTIYQLLQIYASTLIKQNGDLIVSQNSFQIILRNTYILEIHNECSAKAFLITRKVKKKMHLYNYYNMLTCEAPVHSRCPKLQICKYKTY